MIHWCGPAARNENVPKPKYRHAAGSATAETAVLDVMDDVMINGQSKQKVNGNRDEALSALMMRWSRDGIIAFGDK